MIKVHINKNLLKIFLLYSFSSLAVIGGRLKIQTEYMMPNFKMSSVLWNFFIQGKKSQCGLPIHCKLCDFSYLVTNSNYTQLRKHLLLCHESHVGVKEATEQRDCMKANTGSSIARHSIEHEDSLGAQCVEQQSLPCNSQEGEPSAEQQSLPCKSQDNDFHVKCKHGAVEIHFMKE